MQGPQQFQKIKKASIAFLPTPLHQLSNVTKMLNGSQIYVKRDDQTGLASGGNKTRKLEYLVQDAIDKKCDTLMTCGAEQSNCCRQSAAIAGTVGLKCHLLLGGEEPQNATGNLLLDKIFGATIHWTGDNWKGETLPQVKQELEKQGLKPYVIPFGGSSKIGNLGFIYAIKELKQQMEELKVEFDHIFFTSTSGGTHAGLTVGAKLYGIKAKIWGIGNDAGKPEDPLIDKIVTMANDLKELCGMDYNFTKDDFNLVYDYLNEGYGTVSKFQADSCQLMAQQEGILLDPVYSGKSFGALVDMVKKGILKPEEKVLFWHTGGLPGVFQKGKELCKHIE